MNQAIEAGWSLGRPVIAIDHEGRRVNRLRDFHEEELGAAELGIQNDLGATRAFGAQMAMTLKNLGIHVNFAPVLDVEEIEDHPALKGRCFHRNIEMIAKHGSHFLDGMQNHGVSGCGKHFPGHGSAHLDSHIALPESPRDLEALIRRDVQAYPDCFQVGLDMIMTAHVVFPAISNLPSTCNPQILRELLRDKMGYEGLVLSDDCDMEGFRRIGAIRKSAALAMAAGVDVLLCCRDPEVQDEVLGGLSDFYQSGSDAKARVHQALDRINRVKARIFSRFDS
jgi:beta-N-acetylhexosaminidase